MRTRIRKWGNSLAVRIPRPLAEDTGLAVDASVDVVVRDGSVIVTPVRSKPSLAALLRRIRSSNIHAAVETGDPVGREAW